MKPTVKEREYIEKKKGKINGDLSSISGRGLKVKNGLTAKFYYFVKLKLFCNRLLVM